MTVKLYPFTDVEDSTWVSWGSIGLDPIAFSPVSSSEFYSWDFPNGDSSLFEHQIDFYANAADDFYPSSAHRLSSNVNSRKARGELKSCRPPVTYFLGIPEEGIPEAFKVVRRYSRVTNSYVDVKVPNLVRRVKPKKLEAKVGFDILPNALWYRSTDFLTQFGPTGSFEFMGLDDVTDPDNPTWKAKYSYRGLVTGQVRGPEASFVSGFDPVPLLCDSAGLMTKYSTLRAEMEEKSLTKLYAKIKGQKIDLATELAQGAQTVSLIADLSVRLAKTFLQLKKLRLADAVSTLKAPLKTLLPLTRQKMANDFLAYRYGIAPLIGDIQGMAEYIASIVLSEQKIKAAGTSTKYADFVDTGFLGAIIPYKIFRSSKVTVKHNVRFRVNDKLSKAAEELGFTNPANVLWELVPFSFVVDWFLPIGNFLNSMNALEHLTVVDVTRTTVIEEFLFFQLDPSPYELPIDDRNKVNISGLNCLTRNFCCVREVIPTPNLPLPTFKNPLSTGHIANAIALMSQLLKR